MASFCLGCGNSISEDERSCPICGRDAAASGPRVDPGVAFGLAPETSGKAIVSLVCGLLFILLPLSVIAVVFGHLSLSEIRRSGGQLTGRGWPSRDSYSDMWESCCSPVLWGWDFMACVWPGRWARTL